jgi:hypothetical protein
MKIWFSLFLIFGSLTATATATELSGQMQLWQRVACSHQAECTALPEPFGPVWTVKITLTQPTQPGSVTRQSK